MEYVMVPVPEELVDEVKDYLGWQLTAPQVVENPEAVAVVMADLDETLRSMVLTVAHATVDEKRPTLARVADEAGINIREAIGAITDLNNRLRAEGRAAPLIMVRPDPRPRPDGVSDLEHRITHMTAADAAGVLGS